MNRDELLWLIDAGDLHGLMLAVNREWLCKTYPSAEYALLVAHVRDGVPDVQIPIIPSTGKSSSARTLAAS